MYYVQLWYITIKMEAAKFSHKAINTSNYLNKRQTKTHIHFWLMYIKLEMFNITN